MQSYFILSLGTREKDDVYCDPVGLVTDENFARYREAKLKHGRVAMVSVVASVASSIRHNDNIVDVASYLTKGIPVPSLYQLLHEWTLSDIAKFVLLCGFLETIIFVQLNPQDMPGDYGFGYWGVRDKGKNERSLVCELENGRLSMMVVLYYLLHDVLVHPFYREFWERSVANIMGQQ
jgi:hypothetical protein